MSPDSTNDDRSNTGMHWFLKLLLISTLVVFVVGTVLHLLGRAGAARWNRYAASIRAKGDPLTFEEIEKRRAVVPPDQNSGLVIEQLTDELEALRKMSVGREVLVFAKRSSDADFFTGIPRQSISPSHEFLNQQRTLLEKLSVLRDMPTGRIDLDYKKATNTLEITLAQLDPLRTASKLLRLQAMLELIDENVAAAVENTRLQFALGEALHEHPTVIGRLVQRSILSLATQTIEDTLRVGTLADDQLVQLGDLVNRTLADNTMRWGLWGERAFVVGLFDDFAQGKISAVDAVSHAGRGPMISFLPDALIRSNQATATRMLTRLIDVADDPLALLEAAKRMDRERSKLSTTQMFAKMFLPPLSRAVELHLQFTAKLLATKVGLAAERFRLATGALPVSFDDLVPPYLDEIPTDPFSGDPLLFATTKQGIVIYSVGPDGVDDSGIVARQKKRPHVRDVGFRLLSPEHRGVLLIDNPDDGE